MPSSMRHRLLREVLDHVERTGDPVLEPRHRWRIEEVFGDLDGFLLAVAQRWHTTLTARLDAVHEQVGPGDLGGVVGGDVAEGAVRVWRQLAVELPGTRYLLDAYRDRPALAAATRRRRALLLASTGVDLERLREQSRTEAA